MVNLTGLPLEFAPWSHLALTSAGYPPSASASKEPELNPNPSPSLNPALTPALALALALTLPLTREP